MDLLHIEPWPPSNVSIDWLSFVDGEPIIPGRINGKPQQASAFVKPKPNEPGPDD